MTTMAYICVILGIVGVFGFATNLRLDMACSELDYQAKRGSSSKQALTKLHKSLKKLHLPLVLITTLSLVGFVIALIASLY